jgi:hypothetical protein
VLFRNSPLNIQTTIWRNCMSRNIARELNAKNKIEMTNNRKTGRMNEAIKHTFLYLLFSSFHQLEGAVQALS